MVFRFICIIVGLLFILLSKPIGRNWKKFQENYREIEISEKNQQIKSIITGAVFIALGFILFN